MVNPCFCRCSLKTAAKIFAILEMVVATILGVIMVVIGGMFIEDVAGASQSHTGSSVSLAITIIFLLFAVGTFYLGWILKIGAEQRDYDKCRTWMIATAIITFLIQIMLLFQALAFRPLFIALLVNGGYQLFSMWVVHELMREIKTPGPQAGVVYSV